MTNVSEKSDDRELARAIAASNPDAFKILYFRYFDALQRYVFSKIQDKDAAKDIVQDVFMRIYQTRTRLDARKSLKSFLYKIAHNLAIDYLRKRAHQQLKSSITADMELTTESDEADELTQQIREAIAQLPRPVRETFLLNRFEGLKYKEIAEVQGIAVKTVEYRMSKALKLLHQRLSTLLSLLLLVP